MFKHLLIIINLICFGCTSSKSQGVNSFGKGFDFLQVSDTFNLVVTEFYKNNTYPYSEGGVPYSLLIGKSNDIKLPKIISVLSGAC